MTRGQIILLGIVGVGMYLVYRSIANIGYSINAAIAGPTSLATGVRDTFLSEMSAISNSLGNGVNSISSLGTWVGSGAGSTLPYPTEEEDSGTPILDFFDSLDSELGPGISVSTPMQFSNGPLGLRNDNLFNNDSGKGTIYIDQSNGDGDWPILNTPIIYND